MSAAAVLVAAGRGHRFGGGLPKQYADLAGHPVLRHAALAFVRHPGIDHVVAVIHPDDRELYDKAVAGLDLLPPVAGGGDRQQSVHNGLAALAGIAPDVVLVHDAARPLVSEAVIDRVLQAIGPGNGAMPALAVVDSLRRVDREFVSGEADRDGLWRAQTPQGFPYTEFYAAHAAAVRGHTDDVSVAAAAGLTVKVVAGDEDNFKITAADDLRRAESIVGLRRPVCRVGFGYDVHRLGPGDAVWLGGVRIAHDQSLIGHSDADVALHALTDAILGAIGAGDIGTHFPPSDERWRNVESRVFLAEAVDQVQGRGGKLGNLDLTVICERPKIGPHREAIRARIAEIAGLAVDAVSVKATTTEGLGFTGRGEGIAAQAVATVWLPAN